MYTTIVIPISTLFFTNTAPLLPQPERQVPPVCHGAGNNGGGVGTDGGLVGACGRGGRAPRWDKDTEIARLTAQLLAQESSADLQGRLAAGCGTGGSGVRSGSGGIDAPPHRPPGAAGEEGPP
jgi:hypothetical protein